MVGHLGALVGAIVWTRVLRDGQAHVTPRPPDGSSPSRLRPARDRRRAAHPDGAGRAVAGDPRGASRPAVVEARTIGHTVKERGILAWRLGQPAAKRKVVILGAMHGNETGPSRILYNLRDGRPIKGADIWVVPQYNRDGIVRHTRQNAHGVDLNRNYPRNWKRMGGATNSGPRAGLRAGDEGRDGVPAPDPARLRGQLPPAAARRRPHRAARARRSCSGCTAACACR